MNSRPHLAIGASVAAFALSIVLAAGQDRFPEGKGKAEVVKVCAGCHDAEIVLANLKTPAEWADTLQSMAEQGADATPDEWTLIAQYLDSNLAMIAINKAPADDLQVTLDVSREVAVAILDYRRDHGTFKSTEDVKKVPGIDPAKVDSRTRRFVF